MVSRGDESSEALLQFLEQASGRRLRTREDIRRFLGELSAGKLPEPPAARRWRTAKQGMWLLLLVAAFLQYYFLEILVEINSMSPISVNLRTPAQQVKPATRT
jgi:hypothetical protein